MAKYKQGFSLVELLIAVALIGTLLALSSIGLNNYMSTLRLQQAQQMLAQELNLARSNARKKSTDQTISWLIAENKLSISGKTLSFPNQVLLKQVNGSEASSVTYTAPFGRLAGDNVEFILEGKSGKQVSVRIIGVTGKVVQDEL